MFQLIEVKSRKEKKEFLLLPVKLYKNEKNWIRPLDNDIEDVFDPEKNKLLKIGQCKRWLLQDSSGKLVGRVAAFFDEDTRKKYDQPTGGLGFFECINNQEAAFTLFDACKNWLQENGLEAMDGPINFGDRDRWWGCLKDGFTEPNYAMPYNFGYYNDLFEAYGFQNFFNQYTYYRTVSKANVKPEVAEKAERIFQNPDFEFRNIEKKNPEKYAQDFCTVYNRAWARFPGVKQMTLEEAMVMIKRLWLILDERLMIFTYYKNEPIGFFLMHPEINQLIKHINGTLNWWAKLKFMYLLKRGKCNKVLGQIFGIVPEYRKKGVDGAQIMKFAEIAWDPKFPYKDMELNWIGDFNPTMMKMIEQIGGTINKTHVTYRFLFDRTKEFKRASFVNMPGM